MNMRVDPSAFSAGEALLWRHGIVEPEQIDLEGLAAAEGVEVRYRHLAGCEARLVVVGERGIISVRAHAANLGRQRFSLAHELAHWMRDRHTGGVLCSSDDISASDVGSRSRETEANAYASQLVLPDYLIAPRAATLPVSLDAAQELARTFKSSLTAAALKLIRHVSVAAWVVCHRPQAKGWFVKGRATPIDVFVLTDELHHDSPAFNLLYGPEGGRTLLHSEPASHWLSGTSIRGKDVRCQSMKIPDGTVLTLLSLK
jgi:hypothetical protein